MNKNKTASSLSTSPVILHSQIDFLMRHGATWFWGNVFAASLFALLRWADQDENLILLAVWYLALTGMALVRWLGGHHYLSGAHYSLEELQAFAQRYLLYSTLISALWGVSGVILFSSHELVQAVHVVLLAGAVMATLPVLALSRFALYIQISATLLPVTLNLWVMADATHHSLALATLVMGVLLVMASRSITDLLNELHTTQLQMQEQAHTDPVTQIANRRYFDSIFKTEWKRAARDGKSMSLVMIDVDHFKRYNDQHGHHAGDQCLQIIAQCIKTVARRASDVVARHGGEEFVMLLPDTSLEDATQLAERLRKNVEAQRIPHSDGALPRIVTISLGVSCCLPASPRIVEVQGDTVYPAMLLNSADRALYRAKRNGRNQVAWEYCGQSVVKLAIPSLVTHAA